MSPFLVHGGDGITARDAETRKPLGGLFVCVMITNMNKPTVITWRDSNIYLTQCSKDDDFEVAEITSVGFVIKEDKKMVCLAGDTLGDDVRRVICIPKENILKRAR